MISREELILRFMERPKWYTVEVFKGSGQAIVKYPTFEEAAVMADYFIAKAQTEDSK